MIISLIYTKPSLETSQTLYTFDIRGLSPILFEREVKNKKAKVPSIVVFFAKLGIPAISVRMVMFQMYLGIPSTPTHLRRLSAENSGALKWLFGLVQRIPIITYSPTG